MAKDCAWCAIFIASGNRIGSKKIVVFENKIQSKKIVA